MTETAKRRTRGVFHSAKQTTQAVDDLVNRSVPMDDITVTVADASGAPVRELEVNESGARHGAKIGAIAGVISGFLVALLLVGGYAGWSEMWTWYGVSWGLRGAFIGLLAGMPFGALLKYGEWHKREELRKKRPPNGRMVVEVRGDEMADVAREVLEKAGAERVTTT